MKKKKIIISFIVVLLTTSSALFAQTRITILHTNDTHSRIEPIPEGDKTAPNMGGVLRRANYIEQVRKENKNVILLDAGDYVQGTPYYNLFKGKVETEAMNLMKYDVVTLGNHEFDYGLEGMKQLAEWAEFPIISSNYDFSATPLKDQFEPYIVLVRDGVRIGVIGVNVEPKGLIATDNYEGMIFNDPVETVNHYAQILKKKEKCDLIIALSHLGYISDKKLATESEDIDIIIGGHSHTYMKEPDLVKNKTNKDVLIYQTAGRGIYVGRIDVELDKVSIK